MSAKHEVQALNGPFPTSRLFSNVLLKTEVGINR